MDGKRGPGTNDDQIKSLEEKLDATDVALADQIVVKHSNAVVTLAYKKMRVEVAKNKPLPKAVTKALDNLSEEDAAIVRKKLEVARR